MVSNRRIVPMEGPNFYPTPTWGTKALLKYENFHGITHEPCCGDGAMAEELRAGGLSVHASDLYDHGYGVTGMDYLQSVLTVDNVITNPPFNIAEEIFHKAWELADWKIALLLRTAFLEGVGRYERIFSKHPPKLVLVFTQRLTMYPKGAEVKGGGTTSYSWFIWDKKSEGPTTVKWIKPGLKDA